MSSYTMQLRTYIESFTQFEPNLSVRERIEKARTKLFDFDYPIFDPAYKKTFETNFIRHFYMREIGTETEGYFKFNLESWLLLNMPYYNKLFESELLEYDPLTNSKMETTHDKTINKDGTLKSDGTQNTTGNSTQSNDGFQRNINSDTPDTRLNLTTNDGSGILEYASKIVEDKANNTETTDSDVDVTSSTDTTTSQDETEKFIMNRLGKIGVQTYAKMIQEHRQAFLRIEKEMFEEMQPLFMVVY